VTPNPPCLRLPSCVRFHTCQSSSRNLTSADSSPSSRFDPSPSSRQKFRPHRHQHYRPHSNQCSPRIMSHIRLHHLPQAFLQPVHSGYIVNSVGAPGSGLHSGFGNPCKPQDSSCMPSKFNGTNHDGTLVSPNELRRAKVAGGAGDDRRLRSGVSNVTVEAGGRREGGEEIETRTPRICSGPHSLDSNKRPIVITHG